MNLVALRQIDIADIRRAAEQEGRGPPGQEQFAGRAVAIDQSAVGIERIGNEDGFRPVHFGRQHAIDQVGDSLARGMAFSGQGIQHDPTSDARRFRAVQALCDRGVADRFIAGQ